MHQGSDLLEENKKANLRVPEMEEPDRASLATRKPGEQNDSRSKREMSCQRNGPNSRRPPPQDCKIEHEDVTQQRFVNSTERQAHSHATPRTLRILSF